MSRPISLAAIVVSVALAACGGGSTTSSGSGGSATSAPEEKVYALGEEAVVPYAEITSTGERGTATTLGVTPLEVRQGSHAELTQGGFEIDKEDQDTTPYYVDVRYENQGDNAIKRQLDVNLEDADGNLIQNTIIFDYSGKPYKHCVRIREGKLKPGDKYESCTLFLVPEGVEPVMVSILGDAGEDAIGEFVYWEI